jgi:hypothetical protein
MEFTPQETKLIERLRKQERRWPRVRWALLATGVFLAACCTYTLVGLCRSLHFDTLPSSEVLFFAMLWPYCLLAMLGATWLIVWPLTSWHGSVNRMLLLRLLDAEQTQKGHDESIS